MYESNWQGLNLLTFVFSNRVWSPPADIYEKDPVMSMCFAHHDRFFKEILFCIDNEMNIVEVKFNGAGRPYSATSGVTEQAIDWKRIEFAEKERVVSVSVETNFETNAVRFTFVTYTEPKEETK